MRPAALQTAVGLGQCLLSPERGPQLLEYRLRRNVHRTSTFMRLDPRGIRAGAEPACGFSAAAGVLRSLSSSIRSRRMY